MLKLILLILLLKTPQEANSKKINIQELRCLVCRATLDEIKEKIDAVDDNRVEVIGSYRMDSAGRSHSRSIPSKQSEVFLSDLLETICDKMDDYIRGTRKDTGKLVVLKIMSKEGHLNPEFSKIDAIQDSDLNKSLKYYCEEIIEVHGDDIIYHYINNYTNIENNICQRVSSLCPARDTEDESSEDSEQIEL